MGEKAQELTSLAVNLACSARDELNPDALVMGCVTTLEDCYKPEQAPDSDTCKKEHKQIMTHLYEAGVDMILIETMCAAHEAIAAAEAAQEVAPGQWAISLCLSSEEG